jgi:hypothetical protein
MSKVNVKKEKRVNGCDCWGRPEIEYFYVVENKNGEIIYTTDSDPTYLINYLLSRGENNERNLCNL